ncbi:MAG TPA: heme-copper oxidase subunit III [Puia sp.]|nr:heme-copper oxidase subunit III [Puia sp.]
MTQSENRTMMQAVVYTEAFFFLCLIMSYIYLAYSTGFEPHDLSRLDIGTSGINTALLILSSFTLHLAERGYGRGNTRALKAWLIITLILGAIFLIGQGREYVKLIQDKITLESSVFGASFFTLTGFHGLHVFIGLVILSIMLTLAFLGDFNRPVATATAPADTAPTATAPADTAPAAQPAGSESPGPSASAGWQTDSASPAQPGGGALGTVAIYWHFVDIVWIVVFTVVYVLPQFTNI